MAFALQLLGNADGQKPNPDGRFAYDIPGATMLCSATYGGEIGCMGALGLSSTWKEKVGDQPMLDVVA